MSPPVMSSTCRAWSVRHLANIGEISGAVTKSPSAPNLREPAA